MLISLGLEITTRIDEDITVLYRLGWGYPPAGAAVFAESIGTTEVGDVAIGGKRLESWSPILSLDEIPVFKIPVCVKSKVFVVRICN